LFASLYTVFFSAVDILRYRNFAFTDFDFAVNIQKYWNILHSDGRMSLIGDVNIWGNSLELIAYPMSLVYWLLGSSPEALLVLRAAVFGFTAVPIYMIAKEVVPQKFALCLSASFLLNPSLWYLNLAEYYDMTLCILPLSLAFYFLKKERFAAFMAALVVSIMFRADLTLITVMLGVYAFFDRKRLKWVIWPVSVSVIWAVLGILFIRNAASPKISYEVFYSYMGGSFAEIARNLVSNPLIASKTLFTEVNAIFMMETLLPVAFFPLLAIKEFSICLLTLFQHLTSLKPLEHTIKSYYSVTLLPFLYVSFAYGISKYLAKSRLSSKRFGAFFAAFIVAAPLISNVLFGPLSVWKDYWHMLAQRDFSGMMTEYVKRIPADASVITTFRFTPHIANRRHLYSFHYLTRGKGRMPYPGYKVPKGVEYALIDFLDPFTVVLFSDRDSDLRVRKFLEEGELGAVDSFDTVVLFRKGNLPGKTLFRQDADGSSVAVPLARIGGNVVLERSAINKEGRFVEISVSWRCLDPIKDSVSYLFQVMDKNGKEVFSTVKPVCYGIYPMSRWKKGEVITDDFRMFIPAKAAQRGEYDIRMTLFLSDSMRALIMENAGNADINDRYGLLLGPVSF